MSKEEKDFISFVEFCIDWGLYLPESELQRYYNLTESEVINNES